MCLCLHCMVLDREWARHCLPLPCLALVHEDPKPATWHRHQRGGVLRGNGCKSSPHSSSHMKLLPSTKIQRSKVGQASGGFNRIWMHNSLRSLWTGLCTEATEITMATLIKQQPHRQRPKHMLCCVAPRRPNRQQRAASLVRCCPEQCFLQRCAAVRMSSAHACMRSGHTTSNVALVALQQVKRQANCGTSVGHGARAEVHINHDASYKTVINR